MIQRRQTIWLLLAAASSFLSFRFAFYTGNILEDNISRFAELNGGSTFFLLILTGASLLIAAIAIFLYKDRKTQVKLTITGTLIAAALLVLYFLQVKKFTNGNFALTAVFTFVILISYIMATRGIWKDEKLVKSLDKLR